MIDMLTQFGDGSSGIGALGVDGQAFLIQLVTFVFVILVLMKYAVKPILKVLQERRDTIEKGVKLGEQMQKDKAVLEQKVGQALHDARKKADEIVAAAHNQGRQAVQVAEDDARKKAEAILASAEDRISQETNRARKQLEGELVGLISEATEAIIDEKVDAKKDAQLIDRAMKRSQPESQRA